MDIPGDFMKLMRPIGLPWLESVKNGLDLDVAVRFSMLCDVGVSFLMRPELVAALLVYE